ncbi:hypothetical protein [Caminibacter sp.]
MKPLTLPTGKMANYLGISRDFLKDNKDVIFKKGIHYTIPQGKKHPLWIVSEMEKWALGQMQISDTAKEVLNNILS